MIVPPERAFWHLHWYEVLAQLKSSKGLFGPDAARQIEALLKRATSFRFSGPKQVIELHETLLFLRAYPANKRIVSLIDRLLADFAAITARFDPDAFADPDVSGLAGTSVSTTFSHEFAESLVKRHGKAVSIDWENFERPDRLGPVLSSILPAAAEAWTVEPHVDWEQWFKKADCSIAMLLASAEPRAYDLLEIPLVWNLGRSLASRTRARISSPLYIHQGTLLRRADVSFEQEFAAPRIRCRKLTLAEARKIWDVIVDVSAVRYRELWGFLHPDLKHMYCADFGRGVEFYFCGTDPEARLPMRAYHCGMYFKNGVPIGYFEGLSLFDRMEAGFNLYYTFREGETAWLYVRTLKLFRERLGIECFSLDPYQIGHSNEEAIESGAFWFYRKLGFRPASPASERLLKVEEQKLAARPGYRTSPGILRKLAESPMLFGQSKKARFSAVDAALRADRHKHLPWSQEMIRAKFAPEETEFLQLSRSTEPRA